MCQTREEKGQTWPLVLTARGWVEVRRVWLITTEKGEVRPTWLLVMEKWEVRPALLLVVWMVQIRPALVLAVGMEEVLPTLLFVAGKREGEAVWRYIPFCALRSMYPITG